MSLRNIKLTIEYDGTLFYGWQTQTARNGNGSKIHRTVQGEIEKVLEKIFKKKIKLIGSGRTDSGVHALGQVANFKVNSQMPVKKIQSALNANLAKDVSILDVEEVPLEFHAQYSVKSKTYRYSILNQDARSAYHRNFCLFYPYKLNVQKMRNEAKSLIGRKNFKAFTASDPAKRKAKKEENTVRTIKQLSITKKGPHLTVDIEANGFLYKMVRNIVGTLLEIGCNKMDKGSVKKILSQKNRSLAGKTAKAQGLSLLKVKY